MEMCYAGAIAMPSSYVVMNEEEMTYTEGGGKAYDKALDILWDQISNVVGFVLGAMLTKSGMMNAIKAAGNWTWNFVVGGIKTAAAFIWNHAVAFAAIAGVTATAVVAVKLYYSGVRTFF